MYGECQFDLADWHKKTNFAFAFAYFQTKVGRIC